MISFTDLPVSVVSDVLCHWCSVVIVAKVDSSFCSNHGNARTWLLNILPKQYHTVPERMYFTSAFLKWAFDKSINLKYLHIACGLLQYDQLYPCFKLSGVESLSFGLLELHWKGVVVHNDMISTINKCPLLKKLCISPVLSDTHLLSISPLILSQLVSLELRNDKSDLRVTFDMLNAHCSNLNTLVLRGDRMSCDGVKKLISNNPKLQTLNMDCRILDVSDISSALWYGKCENVSSITLGRFSAPHYLVYPSRLVEYCKGSPFMHLDVGFIQYGIEETGDGHKHIRLRICMDTVSRFDCRVNYDALLSKLPDVNTIRIDKEIKDIIIVKDFMTTICSCYATTLTTVIFHEIYSSLRSTGFMEIILKSCLHVKNLEFVSTNQISCKSIQKLCETFPQLQEIVLDHFDIVTSVNVIDILSSTMNNVTKVTARSCCYVVESEVREAVAKLNANSTETKYVQFEYLPCNCV